MDFENFVEDDEKKEIGDLSSNLEGYFGSKVISTSQDNVEGNKEKITKSNDGLEALGDDQEKQSVHPSPPMRTNNEEKMEKENVI